MEKRKDSEIGKRYIQKMYPGWKFKKMSDEMLSGNDFYLMLDSGTSACFWDKISKLHNFLTKNPNGCFFYNGDGDFEFYKNDRLRG